jgi:DNA-binding MarR family transcriptional regulator
MASVLASMLPPPGSGLINLQYASRMADEDLSQLGEDLITTAARIVRWVPKPSRIRLSLAAARILARINDNGSCRISDVADQERSSQPTITNHVKRLESAGFVARSPDADDARAWRIRLTEAGQQELAEMQQAVGTSLEPYLARMSRRDRKALHAGVDAMQRLIALDRLPE